MGDRSLDTGHRVTITMAQLELLADTLNTTLHNLLKSSFNGTIVRDIVDLHQFENLTLGGNSEIQPEATFALTSFIGEYENQYPHPHCFVMFRFAYFCSTIFHECTKGCRDSHFRKKNGGTSWAYKEK